MKIRTGYVSNSSTTSFCIYGTKIDYTEDFDQDDIETYDNIFNKDFIKRIKKEIDDPNFIKLSDHEDMIFETGQYDDIYIGGSYGENMELNETKSEFHNRVEKYIKSILRKDIEIEFYIHEECWMFN